MPTMSEREVLAIGQNIQRRDAMITSLKKKVKDLATGSHLVEIGEAIGGAAAMGYARGRFEKKGTGEWNIPGTSVDVEMVALFGLIGVALAGSSVGLGKFAPHAANLCAGIGGHYAGQIARKMGSTGSFSMIAGSHVGALPQYDPVSYQPTQFAGPYDDPVASALSSTGI